MSDTLHLKKSVSRKNLQDLESAIKSTEGSLGEDPFPLEHFFAKGLYVRKLTIPKGYFVVGKIHKYSHVVIYLSGDVTVVSEDGKERISEPRVIVSPEGAKRAFYAHEETVMLNVHATESDDLDYIEDALIAKNYDELNLSKDVIREITEEN